MNNTERGIISAIVGTGIGTTIVHADLFSAKTHSKISEFSEHIFSTFKIHPSSDDIIFFVGFSLATVLTYRVLHRNNQSSHNNTNLDQ